MNQLVVKRPWGSFVRFTNNESSTVKLLYVNKGEEFSLQYHNQRTEFWKILKGSPEIIIGNKTEHPKEGDEFVIAPQVNHRLSAPVGEVVVLEISTGHFDEEDLVRIKDKYNRK